ncbi:MAG: methionine biosynthesis protein MetW [Alphaproteobacteria bacterium]|jgi:methionine biosynthesis protein MetW|uniref:Methionine biosynthesis protein MetW n=1 Tax=PS1 clade bacterium TaxID=2175152 RepID=A0A368DJK0_9PROT|nr:MAG: methionine biosynthesis protein MetW [PS1 clade bacterium]
MSKNRQDFLVINDMVTNNSKVLDVGCDDGSLLKMLQESKNVDARGIEISAEGVNTCLAKGLSAVQGDANLDLEMYPENSFDFVILSKTLQSMIEPKKTLEELLRIGKNAIVSIPNFAHWKVRLYLLLHGRMPVTPSLPDTWYNTENIHLCTINDFINLCEELEIQIIKSVVLDKKGNLLNFANRIKSVNLIGEQGIFLLKRK